MTDHEITIERYVPEGKRNYHYIAICSCRRWWSNPYREYGDADKKGLIHSTRGDDDNRKNAALDRGSASLLSSYKWYLERASDPFIPDNEREMWKRLADELAPRVQPRNFEQDDPLF